MNNERKLVTYRTVSALEPIPGADAIEVATVDGWKCVVKRGVFSVDDVAVYFEIDSFLPTISQFEFLRSRGTKKMMKDGKVIEGYRLKTVKLRGQVSQGLLLPLSDFPELSTSENSDRLDEVLGVMKYEPDVPPELQGFVKGSFPSFLSKSDQERIQNISTKELLSVPFEVTEKLDGTSFTAYVKDGVVGVCSRNMELKLEEENAGNLYVRMFNENALGEKLVATGRNIAVQGEIVGSGVQGNPYKAQGQKLYVYDVFDIDSGSYLLPNERFELLEKLELLSVPVIQRNYMLSAAEGVEDILTFAEGKSVLADVQREGLVFKSERVIPELPSGLTKSSFKVISNAYLLGEKD